MASSTYYFREDAFYPLSREREGGGGREDGGREREVEGGGVQKIRWLHQHPHYFREHAYYLPSGQDQVAERERERQRQRETMRERQRHRERKGGWGVEEEMASATSSLSQRGCLLPPL